MTPENRENNISNGNKSNGIYLERKRMPEKKFQIRQSVVTQLLEDNKHIRTVYNFALGLFFYFVFNSAIRDIQSEGRIKYGFRMIYLGFSGFKVAILVWIGYQIAISLVFYFFKCWAFIRYHLKPRYISAWDKLWLALLVVVYVGPFHLTPWIIRTNQIGAAASLALLSETVRAAMKIHSFIRTCVPRILSFKPHDDKDFILPKFSSFFYFLFAPTAIYRDDYPRTDKIRWNVVVTLLLKIPLFVIVQSFVLEYIDAHVSTFCIEKFTVVKILMLLSESTVIGFLGILVIFSTCLHITQNVFAELLRFGDRQFYDDWWTVSSLSYHFRKGNMVVGDWLYAYIYKDMYEIVAPGKRWLAALTTLLISDIVHEWGISHTIRHFFPILSIYLWMGIILNFCITYQHNNFTNIMFIYLYSFGVGSGLILHSLEYYTIQNAPADANVSESKATKLDRANTT